MNPLDLLQELVSLPAPPGQEGPVRNALGARLDILGVAHRTDAKGNLLANLGAKSQPKIVVTAHMDEISMFVRRVESDGRLAVGPMGGLYPWKLGEGPVLVLSEHPCEGVLSFGSIHTADPASTVRRADQGPVDWDGARVVTGLPTPEVLRRGVRPGTRVVVSPKRRDLQPVGELVAGYFLDDRADLVSWLLAIEELKDSGSDVLFAATTAEEVGGEGAQYLLTKLQPDVCIALELGPTVHDAPVLLNDQPTVWANDSYAAMSTDDGELIAALGLELGMSLQFQALSRGGSDASCAAGRGLCARPITLGLPMENSHGFEIIHPNSMSQLARLVAALVRALDKEAK